MGNYEIVKDLLVVEKLKEEKKELEKTIEELKLEKSDCFRSGLKEEIKEEIKKEILLELKSLT